MLHVGHRVRDRPLGERPGQPVGQPIGLRQPEAQLPLHQARQTHAAVAHEPGRHLRVEQAPGQGAAHPGEDLEVLAGGVHEAHAITVEHRGERRDVDDGGVDYRRAARPGELQQRQPGVVGPLPVELRVEAVGIGRGEVREHLAEPRVGVDPGVSGRTSWDAQPLEASLPVRSIGSPTSIQARVPPATLTASMPSER